jgi:hypothetical protein
MKFTDWCYLRAMDIEAMNLSPADAKAFLALARSAFEAGAKVQPATPAAPVAVEAGGLAVSDS